jgi:hypothetical protein
MDPQSPPSSGFETAPVSRQSDMIPLAMSHEATAAVQETAPHVGQSAPQMPAFMQTPNPASDPIALSSQPSTAAITATTPAVANDIDLIEKEWVNKAKAIVAQTRTDPHAQNQQMNVMKADYMKKRYNKDIKTEN